MTERGLSDGAKPARNSAVITIAFSAIVMAELVILSFLYKDVVDFECSSTGLTTLCLKISELPLRALGVFGVLFLMVLARPDFFRRLWVNRNEVFDVKWMGLHLIGVALVALPMTFMSNAMSGGEFLLVIVLWIVGALCASLGAIFTIFAPGLIIGQIKDAGFMLLVAAFLGFMTPEIARVAQFAWEWPFLREITYDASEMALNFFWAGDVVADPATHILGVGDFLVRVGEQCSGIEGFALITLFFGIYVALFHQYLRLGRIWILLPIGLLLSWVMNIVRITALISMGVVYSPEHAINGFHSHAGWFFFAILALGIATIGHSISWFRKDATAVAGIAPNNHRLPFLEDPNSAQIFPFIVFMASALLVSTFVEQGEVFYPFRFLALAIAVFLFRRYIIALEWRVDPVAVGAGILIAAMWLFAYRVGGGGPEAFDVTTLGSVLFTLWVVTRILGTTILVPIVEELFFRKYLLGKFDNGSIPVLLLGIAITSGFFAMMHSKWEIALIAGVIFAALVIRKEGRITDAIVAHAVANGLIAARAIQTGNWGLI